MHLKDIDVLENSVEPDQTAPKSSLIRICTVCSYQSVIFFGNFMVYILPCSKVITCKLLCILHINIYFQSTNSSKRARQSLNSKWPNTQAPLYPSSDSLLLSPETPVSIQSMEGNLRCMAECLLGFFSKMFLRTATLVTSFCFPGMNKS